MLGTSDNRYPVKPRAKSHRAVGTLVRIYYDPITRQRPEGRAEVLRVTFDHGDDLVYCRVRFCSDGDISARWVDREQLCPTQTPGPTVQRQPEHPA